MATSIDTSATSDSLIRAAGGFAIVSAMVSAVGIVFLIAMFAYFAAGRRESGLFFGLLNDICVALQYLLTIPIAIALYRILAPHNPVWIRVATIWGIASMMAVIALQLLLVFGVLTFNQQGVWASLGILVGVGAWLVATGLLARTTGRFPNSVAMSAAAVPYFGYPVWAFWLARLLLGW
jgi:uncharacterized BrkB/YihY/UPF0761 family membrane protein